MRNNFIITKPSNIIEILNVIDEEPHLTRNRLSTKVKITGGNSCKLTDALILRLIKNGNGYELTDLGREFIKNPENRSTKKTIGLMVPLFEKYYGKNPIDVNENKIVNSFKEELGYFYPNGSSTLERHAKASAKIYLELIHDKKPKGRRVLNERLIKLSENPQQMPLSKKPILWINNEIINIDKKTAVQIIIESKLPSGKKTELIMKL